jgi:hypothetical protein
MLGPLAASCALVIGCSSADDAEIDLCAEAAAYVESSS